MPPKTAPDVDPENIVDNIEPPDPNQSQYDAVDSPLDSAYVDQQVQEAIAQERARTREAIADALAQALQQRTLGQQVDVVQSQYDIMPLAPARNVDVQAAEIDDVLMERIEPNPLPSNAERAAGGSDVEPIYGPGPAPAEYGRVNPNEMLVDVASFNAAKEALESKAAEFERNQQHAAAKAARARRNNRIMAAIGMGSALLSTIGVVVSILMHRPLKTEHITATDADGGKGNDPTKPVSVDVTKYVVLLDASGSIDKASIKLYPSDDGVASKKTIVDLGIWQAKSDGTVTFTPDAKFPGGPVTILYTIADTNGNRTPRAAIQIDFTTKRIAGTGGPVATDYAENDLIIGGAQQIALLSSSVKVGSSGTAVAADSVEFLAPDLHVPSQISPYKSYFAKAQGTWDVSDKGVVTFRPILGFLGGDARILYRVKDTSGLLSDSAEIKLTYKLRPVVASILVDVPAFAAAKTYSANVLDGKARTGTGGTPAAAAADGLTIDPKSVILTNIVKHEQEVRGPDAKASNGMKKLVVDGEGTWDASDPTGKITFTPEADLTEDPHPVIFQVADNKSVLSNAAMLIMSSHAVTVEKKLSALNAMDDTAFWKNYETEVIKADLGDDPITALLVIRSINSTLQTNTRSGIVEGSGQDTHDQIRTVRDDGGLLTPNSSFLLWRAGQPTDHEPPLSPEKLFTLSKKIDDAAINAAVKAINSAAKAKNEPAPISIDATTPLVTRFIRLAYINSVLAAFNRVIFNVNSKQASVPKQGVHN